SARTQQRHANSERSRVQRQRFGQTDNGELRSNVWRTFAGERHQSRYRAGVHDVAVTSFDHLRQEGVNATDHAEDIDAETPPPVRQVDLLERTAQHDAGVVHDQTHRTEPGLRFVCQAFDV